MTSDEVVIVEVEPIRMATIERTNIGEMKVRLSEAEIRGNITSNKNVIVDMPNTIFGLSKFYWILVGAATSSLILSILLFCICKNKCINLGQDHTNPQSTMFIQNNTIIKSQGEDQHPPKG